LIGQGALAFQLWFGVLPDRAIARERLMRILAERGG
jgi:shikimate 5-dehydrogenase